MRYEIKGKDLEDCLTKAEKKYGIKKHNIKYEVLKENKGFFSRKETIITFDIEEAENEETNKDNETNNSNTSSLPGEEIEVRDNQIILDSDDNHEYELYFDIDINILVNDKKINNGTKVSSKDKIVFKTGKIDAKRNMNVNVTPMKVTITTQYECEYLEKIYCRKINGNLRVKKKMEEGRKPPLYKRDEIIALLNGRGVEYGIINDAIAKATTEYDIKDLVVAEGLPVIDDEDDKINYLFQSSKKKVSEDSKEKVDYRNSNFIANVCAGDKIAEIVIGKVGQNGKDIFGVETPRKLKSKALLKPGQGCKLTGNDFYALIDGQPTVKSGMLHVHKVLESPGDVDMKSGNIRFSGDVSINGNVKDGMTVECGNSLEIMGNVESATVQSQGETNIHGSIINSTVEVGSKNMEKQNHIEALEDLKTEMETLIPILMDIKERNMFDNKSTDGQIVKGLIETRFKTLPKKALKALNGVGGDNYKNICNFIRGKIIGSGPLKIKFTSEINEFISWLGDEITELKGDIFIPVDVHIGYSQDSKISATGNVYLEGKGEYITEIISKKDIIFNMGSAVARGGTLKANNIVAKIIGSSAGVTTELRVPKNGTITADRAYQNTVLYFGEMRYVFEKASREVKAYVDKKGEIVVDKLLL